MEDQRKTALYKIVLVVGNGFDIDLGLPTRYSDFLGSVYFKRHIFDMKIKDIKEWNERKKSGIRNPTIRDWFGIDLFDLLEIKRGLTNWVDIERELALVASLSDKKEPFETLAVAESSYFELQKALCEYIKSLSFSGLREDSVAFKLVKALNAIPKLVEVLSYNYTDWDVMFPQNKFWVDYIHGCVKDDSIILGIQDDLDIQSQYCYMIKTFSEHFHSHRVMQKLMDANEVIFFGHSLGETDYHYFETFFRQQTHEEYANKDLIIRIFTYDEKSRREILMRLREMNNKRTDYLYGLCDFEVYRTSQDEDLINRYIENIAPKAISRMNEPILRSVWEHRF